MTPRIGSRPPPPPGETLYLRLVQDPWRRSSSRAGASDPTGRSSAPRTAGSRRAVRAARGRRLQGLAAAARHGSRRHGRGGAGQVRACARGRSALRLLRTGRPRDGWIVPPVPLLLLHERLPLDVRRRERPRGGLGAGVRLSGGRARRARGRSGSRPRRTITSATSCAAAGTTRRSRRTATTRSLYAGAGSHASYFEHGEYLTRSRCPALRASAASSKRCAASGATRCASPTRATSRRRSERALSVPFVDYARGDGLVGRAGQDATWTPSSSMTTTPGSTATAGCSGWTRTTGSVASARRRGRSTAAPARSGSPGTTRWVSPASTRSRRPRASQTSCGIASRVARQRLHELDEAIERRSGELPGLDLETRSLAADGAMATPAQGARRASCATGPPSWGNRSDRDARGSPTR